MNDFFYQMTAPRTLVRQPLAMAADAPGPGRIVARTLVSAISPGTELAAYRGEPPLRPGPIYPRLMGYCNVAEITAVGSDVKTWRPGRRILTFQSHRSAFECRAEDVVCEVPGDMDAASAAVAYLFHLGYSALIRAAVLAGSRVAVVGLGCLGLTAVAVARMAGCSVTAYSDLAERDALALRFGARAVRRKAGLTEPMIAEDGGATGFDVVVDTSNRWEDWFLSLRLARKGGAVCVVGFPGRAQAAPSENPLASQWFYDKQLALIACGQLPETPVPVWENRFIVSRNCAYLMEQIRLGVLPAAGLVSKRVPAAELESVYRSLDQRDSGVVTAVLEWT